MLGNFILMLIEVYKFNKKLIYFKVNYLVRKLKASFPYRKDVDYSKIITKNKPVTGVEAALDSEPEDIESDDDEVWNIDRFFFTRNLSVHLSAFDLALT